MELASRIRWILILIVGVLFLFLVGWGLFSIASNLFNSGADEEAAVIGEPTYNIPSAATALFTVDGPVVATEEHRSYTIAVSQNVVTMKVFKNYGQTVIAEKSYTNNAQAFDTFLSALEALDVSARQRGTTIDDDTAEMGVCPNGRRFILQVDADLRRWSTSCSSRQGTAGFAMNQVESLFQRQIPDFRTLNSGTGL
jgi:hypothetical protein